MHRIAVLALDSVVAFDLSIPAQIFGHRDERDRYALTVCARARRAGAHARPASRSSPTHGLGAVRRADTVVVPGIEETAPGPPRGRRRRCARPTAAARG